MAKDPLETYREKRDFRRTPEPQGGAEAKDAPRFVIQKHDASTRHYDFRLEVEGVLKSWAVPKGPSTDPREKRLAVPTEDHPLDYAGFEGTIPEGEYGAGRVIVWDAGTYESPKDESVADQIDGGHVVVVLKGRKLRGGFALTRTSDDRWLLVKTRDDEADARRNPVSTEPESVLSGRTIEEIEEES